MSEKTNAVLVLLALMVFTTVSGLQAQNPDDYSQPENGAWVDTVWKMLDANQDGRSTDRELDAAVTTFRRYVNSREADDLRTMLKNKFDRDNNGFVDKAEALPCLVFVRGEKCPSVAQAISYWKSLDENSDGAVSPAEFQAAISPLGKVGQAMAPLLGNTLKNVDRNRNSKIEKDEVVYSANTILRIKMATQGERIANREPREWIMYVSAVAQLDTDADNLLSAQETRALSGLSQRFNSVDKNGDKQLSVSEICDYSDHLGNLMSAAAARSFSGSC